MSHDALDTRQPASRSTLVRAAAAGGLLVVVAVSVGWFGGAASPQVVEGWAKPNAAGTAVSLHESPQDSWGDGYVIAGAEWRDVEGVWHDGADSPTCVGTDTGSFTHVRFGLVAVKKPEGGTREQVSWLECLATNVADLDAEGQRVPQD